jgi:hypothetical protein
MSDNLQKFLKSMEIGFFEWHDGTGYDLEILNKLNPEETKFIETLLISRKDQDWRDVEGLATLKTPLAIEALKACLTSPNNEVKLFAVRYLKEMNIMDRIDEVVGETLPQTRIGGGFTYALSLIEKYPSEILKHKVLWCVINGDDDIRIHCAAMALFLYGKAKSNFDMEQKIVFEFKDADRSKRIDPFFRLCHLIGVDPGEFIYG